MKKLFITVLIMIVPTVQAWSADSITNFTLSSPTTTTLAFRLTNGLTAADYDSLTIVRSDSTCIKVVGTTAGTIAATSGIITGLQPHNQYICYIRGKLKTGGYTASNLDTMYTAWPNVEKFANMTSSEWMYGARSWLPSNITYDSLYISKSTGLDSTMVYWVSPYTSIQAKGIGDSSKVKLLIFNGRGEETNVVRETSSVNTGMWAFNYLPVDSLSITSSGWTQPRLMNIAPSDHFYIRAIGQTNNGNATKVIIRLYRRME